MSTCSFIGANVSVHLTKNLGKSNQPVDENPLKLTSGGAENGLLYCKFQQSINANASSNADLPDLSKPYFLLIARGPIHSPKGRL